MTSRRSNLSYSSASTYNNYSTLDRNNRSKYLSPRSVIEGRSPSPANVEAELSSLKKDGKDYHVSVNLNSLVSTNHVGPRSRTALQQSNFTNRHEVQTTGARSLEKNQIVRHGTSNGRNSFLDAQPNSLGSSKTVLTLDRTDDSELYELHRRHQGRKNLLAVSSTPKLSTGYSISPQVNHQESGFAVKSVSSNNSSQADRQIKRNERVEFDLFLKGQMPRDAQRSKIWEVVGAVPAQENVRKDGSLLKQNRSSRSAARAVNDDIYDEVDARQTKDTTKELEDLLLCHPLICDTPGDKIRIERQKDQFVEPPRNASEGLVNVDIVEERVELVMKNGEAHILVKVTCSRTVPLENSPYFKKSSVVVIKSMDFDMMESEERKELYEMALHKQNKAPGGQLDQQETNKLYKALMQLIKTEHSSVIDTSGSTIRSNRQSIYADDRIRNTENFEEASHVRQEPRSRHYDTNQHSKRPYGQR